MKIVVIGGSGMIGARVVALLRAQEHEVVAASSRAGINVITGEGLDAALHGAHTVIDVSNAPSYEPNEVMAFFTTATANLMKAEARAGVKHHVVLSIVGTDRMPENGYYRAKVAQEKLVEQADVPYSIVRATQFYEFLAVIADVNTVNGRVHAPNGLLQPIAADDVARMIVEIALGAPLNRTVDIAGPAPAPFAQMVGAVLEAQGDAREVVVDPQATYFGGTVEERSLVPLGEARLGRIALDDWLQRAEA
jgi:uncharacterized protein YbjT (DUF2867 family)